MFNSLATPSDANVLEQNDHANGLDVIKSLKPGDVFSWWGKGHVHTAKVEQVYNEAVSGFPCYWYEPAGQYSPAPLLFPAKVIIEKL